MKRKHWFTVRVQDKRQYFFYWNFFAKFRPEKKDFDLCKGFFMTKLTKICQISIFKIPNCQSLMMTSAR